MSVLQLINPNSQRWGRGGSSRLEPDSLTNPTPTLELDRALLPAAHPRHSHADSNSNVGVAFSLLMAARLTISRPSSASQDAALVSMSEVACTAELGVCRGVQRSSGLRDVPKSSALRVAFPRTRVRDSASLPVDEFRCRVTAADLDQPGRLVRSPGWSGRPRCGPGPWWARDGAGAGTGSGSARRCRRAAQPRPADVRGR